MPRVHSSLIAIAVAASLQLACAGAHAVELSPQSLERVDRLAARFVQPHGSPASSPPPSLSIAIGEDGRLLLARAYGQARGGVPATELTVYHVGSLTKQFTAAAMLPTHTEMPLDRAPEAPQELVLQ
jgi:CubicO group peptidase (beta-lactamase class C family)